MIRITVLALIALSLCCSKNEKPMVSQVDTAQGSTQSSTLRVDPDSVLVSTADKLADSLKGYWRVLSGDSTKILADHAKLDYSYSLERTYADSVSVRKFMEISECGGDSLFVLYFASGNVEYSFLASDHFFLSTTYNFTNGLQPGLTPDQVKAILGRPMRDTGNVMSYGVLDWGEREYSSREVYRENIILFFEGGVLRYVWQQFPFYDC